MQLQPKSPQTELHMKVIYVLPINGRLYTNRVVLARPDRLPEGSS